MTTDNNTTAILQDTSVEELSQQAIKAALESSWDLAIKLNGQVLESLPDNVDASNRLAKAYLESGKAPAAKKIWRRVLEIDPYNIIARKNLKRVVRAKGANQCGPGSSLSNLCGPTQGLFLEEPGKTKIVCLVKLATPAVLSSLSSGHRVTMIPKKHGISVYNNNNNYVGALPDDVAHHLLNLITGGNRYDVFIKGINPCSVQVLIREAHRAAKFMDQPSFFPEEKSVDYYPYVREEALKVKDTIEPDVDLTNEEKEEYHERGLPTPLPSIDNLAAADEI